MMCNYPPDQELRLVAQDRARSSRIDWANICKGWRTCFASHHTIDLLLEHFDFEWDASIWNDDLPYMIEGYGKKLHGNSVLVLQRRRLCHPDHQSDAANALQHLAHQHARIHPARP